MHMKMLYLILLLPLNLYGSLNIAILDTGFCPRLIVTSQNITINKTVDLTGTIKNDYCQKFNIHSERFHGHLVLEEFLHYLIPTTEKIKITPYVVFDNSGLQKEIYWKSFINKKFDLVISAVGLISPLNISSHLNGIWFIAAPRIGPNIKKDSIIYPANIAPQDNLFLIGNYFSGTKILFDEAQLYQKQIKYFFPQGDGDLVGTSRAVSEAAAKALTLCRKSFEANLQKCLEKNKKVIGTMNTY